MVKVSGHVSERERVNVITVFYGVNLIYIR